MYHPYSSWDVQVLCAVYFGWMSNIVPGGASGVALKSKIPWRYVWYDSSVFTFESLKRFRVMRHCGMRRSHSDTGNLVSVLARPDKKISQVMIARSA